MIEIILKFYNPFIGKKDSSIEYWSSEPNFTFRIQPENFQRNNTIFFLSTSPKDSLHSNLWVQEILRLDSNHTSYEIADISIGINALHNVIPLKKYLTKYKPNTLIISMDVAIMNDFIKVPNIHFDNVNSGTFISAHNSEILNSLKFNVSRSESDSIILFNPYQTHITYQDSTPTIEKKLLSRAKSEAALLTRNLLSLFRFCETEDIKLIITPSPILWRSDTMIDRHSKIALNKVVLIDRIPCAWYSELYFKMLNDIENKLPKEMTWIELYKYFPTDSRFFYDGCRLNKEGQILFGEMYHGRVNLVKEYNILFK
ncbi:MAG: hypothetical protein J5I91_08580 [Bacteroidetes bacterium]|nr:hypothetical protein [Bacteroidota bacterium]